MPKPVYEQEDVIVLWNQVVHTDREVTANRPDIKIKKKKEKTYILRTVRCSNFFGEKCCAKESRKKAKIQEFVYRDITNVEPEMEDYISNNLSHWKSNKRFKEKFGIHTMETFNRFTNKDSCTGNITHNTDSTAV
jgi:uncharacterized protein YabN with tetrapyrrole methylase and pyrophosphatase domain